MSGFAATAALTSAIIMPNVKYIMGKQTTFTRTGRQLCSYSRTHTHTHTYYILLFMRQGANNPLLFCYHSRALIQTPYTTRAPELRSPIHQTTRPPQHAKRLRHCVHPSPLNFYLICRLRKLIVCLLLSVKTIENILATVTLAESVLETWPWRWLGGGELSTQQCCGLGKESGCRL